MEPHSLVLLSGSTLDACHGRHGTQARRVQPVPGPRRPFHHLAQGLARLLPQLRHLSRRWRRGGQSTGGNAATVRTWNASSEAEVPIPSLSTTDPDVQLQVQRQRLPRWRAPRWRRLPRIRQHDSSPCQQEGSLPVVHQQLLILPLDKLSAQQQTLQQVQPEVEQQQMISETPAHHHLITTRQHVASVPLRRGPLRRLGRLLCLLGSRMRPQGPGENDKNTPERVLNVMTCGMFFQAGGKIVRLCGSLAARRFGWAFVAVGIIATIYHGSWGRFRNMARKVDYYSIAVTSMLLRSAVVGPAPRWLAAAMLTAIPFKPTLVSTANFTAVEVRYMLLALSHRHLLAEWAAHTGMSVAATACFTMEDTPLLSWFPYTHAAFHTLSAAAFLTLPSALNHLTSPLPAAAAA